MAYTKLSAKTDSRKAHDKLEEVKKGKQISTADADHMEMYLNKSLLSDDDKAIATKLGEHLSSRAKDGNHMDTEVVPYNGSKRWITLPNGAHLLVNSGKDNYNRTFKETNKKGEHFATVKRRTTRADGTAKAGDRRDFEFAFDTTAHPPDPIRAEQDKKHNLVTIYQGKDEEGKDKFRRINLKELNTLVDKKGRSKKFT